MEGVAAGVFLSGSSSELTDGGGSCSGEGMLVTSMKMGSLSPEVSKDLEEVLVEDPCTGWVPGTEVVWDCSGEGKGDSFSSEVILLLTGLIGRGMESLELIELRELMLLAVLKVSG